jgi:hypothetical protein
MSKYTNGTVKNATIPTLNVVNVGR